MERGDDTKLSYDVEARDRLGGGGPIATVSSRWYKVPPPIESCHDDRWKGNSLRLPCSRSSSSTWEYRIHSIISCSSGSLGAILSSFFSVFSSSSLMEGSTEVDKRWDDLPDFLELTEWRPLLVDFIEVLDLGLLG